MSQEYELEDFAPGVVIGVTLIAVSLRVLLLPTKSLWLDETFSVWLASNSVTDMMQWIVRIDQHPPLYYLLLHYWIALNGDTPYDVRLLSGLIGAGTIPIIYLIGKRMSGVLTGVAAAVILAFSPFHIYYGQEARMYTLLTFNAAVAIYALVRLLTDSHSAGPIGAQFWEYLRSRRSSVPVQADTKRDFSYKDELRNQPGWRSWIYRIRWISIQAIETDLAWLVFVVFSAATMLSHNTAVLFPLATNIFVLGLILYQRMQGSGAQPAFQAPPFWNWAKAQIGILLLWSPWIPSFIRQVSAVDRRFWIPEPTWDSVIQVLKFFLNASGPIPPNLATVIWTLYAVVLCLGLVHYRKKISQFAFLAALFAIPFLSELIVSIRRPIFWDRTLIWTTIPLFLVLAAGIAQLKFRFVVILVLGSLSTINLFSAGDYFRFYQKEDWASAAGYVALFAEQDDLVLFNSNFVEIPFNYYFEQYEEGYFIRVEKRGFPQDLFDSGIPEPEMTTKDIPRLISLLDGRDRVWLVYSHDLYTDPMGLIPRTLCSHMKLARTREFNGGKVQLYVRP